MSQIQHSDFSTTDCYELLVAAGVFEHVASDLVTQYDPQRIVAVVDYCVNLRQFRHPPSAIVKALEENWELNVASKDKVNSILGKSHRGDR